MPLVFAEGFDPGNALAPAVYIKNLGPAFHRLQQVGFDITVVDYSLGGGDVPTSGREVAEAISYARQHQNWGASHPGLKFPLVGVSMGGLTTKIALASWEEGRYLSSGSEPITGQWPITTTSPPVSTWISVAGPHGGGSIPRALQTFTQNVAIGLSAYTDGYYALNSLAAKQMLNYFVPGYTCSGEVFWEGCTALNIPTLKTGNIVATGYECPSDSTLRDAFFQDINRRGIGPANGFPQNIPLKVALSNGSWYRQSCERLPGGAACDPGIGTLDPEGRPVLNASYVGKLSFEDGGHFLPAPFALCDRSTKIQFQINTLAEVLPGDLSGRGPSNLKTVGLPKQVTQFDVQFFLPFMFIPTDGSLGCPLTYPGADGTESPADAAKSNDVECQNTNRANARFHYVHSNPVANDGGKVYNGSHEALSEVLANRFLAYIYDARPGGDADGWIGTGNPFFNPAIHIADCNDGVYSLDNVCS